MRRTVGRMGVTNRRHTMLLWASDSSSGLCVWVFGVFCCIFGALDHIYDNSGSFVVEVNVGV